jgi:hypothetical protein
VFRGEVAWWRVWSDGTLGQRHGPNRAPKEEVKDQGLAWGSEERCSDLEPESREWYKYIPPIAQSLEEGSRVGPFTSRCSQNEKSLQCGLII